MVQGNNFFFIVGVVFSLIILVPFLMRYWFIYSFLREIVQGDLKKAKKRIKKEKLLEIIFKEERIKTFIHYKLDELTKLNYSLSLFYINFALVSLIASLTLSNNEITKSFANGLNFTFFGITIMLFFYLAVKVWLQIRIVELLIKLDEMEIKFIKELSELEEEKE